MTRLTLTAALLALTLAAPSYAAQPPRDWHVPDGWAGGGQLRAFFDKKNELNRAGRRVVIDRDGCTSACAAVFLLADRVCVGSDTVFEFHGPQNGLIAGLVTLITVVPPPVSFMDETKADKIREAQAFLLNERWPGMGDWFLSSGAADLAGSLVVKVKGRELNRVWNVPICE